MEERREDDDGDQPQERDSVMFQCGCPHVGPHSHDAAGGVVAFQLTATDHVNKELLANLKDMPVPGKFQAANDSDSEGDDWSDGDNQDDDGCHGEVLTADPAPTTEE